jgi:Fe-S-cluster containining protein
LKKKLNMLKRMLSTVRFDNSVSNKQDLLERMRRYAAERRQSNAPLQLDGGIMPGEFANDADRVLDGTKALLDDSSKFNFSCTSCGKCCRSLADNVMLDPYDVWLITRKLGVGTAQFHRAYEGSAFTRHLGDFAATQNCADEYEENDENGENEGVQDGHEIPVLMMQTDDNGQCHFARRVDEHADESDRRLWCTLGADSMPMACSLYPLGELWQRPDGAKRFFSLDTVERCEGLEARDDNRRTVAIYRHHNALNERSAQWRWFEALAKRFAAHRFPTLAWRRSAYSMRKSSNAIDKQSITALNTMFALTHDAIYNFDALPIANGGYESWPDAQRGIESALDIIAARSAQFISFMDAQPSSRSGRMKARKWFTLFERQLFTPLYHDQVVAQDQVEDDNDQEEFGDSDDEHQVEGQVRVDDDQVQIEDDQVGQVQIDDGQIDQVDDGQVEDDQVNDHATR